MSVIGDHGLQEDFNSGQGCGVGLGGPVVVDTIAAGSTANTVHLMHVVIIFFLRFGVVVSRVTATFRWLLSEMNRMHGAGVKEAIELGVFGVFPVGALNTMRGRPFIVGLGCHGKR